VSEYSLEPAFPLGGITPRVDEFEALTLRENADLVLVSLAQREAGKTGLASIAQAHFGGSLPEPGCRFEGQNCAIFWVAPGQWFFETHGRKQENLVISMSEKFGETASITDQSDGWVAFDLEGPNVLPVLERLCQLDIHSSKSGFAARSVIDHMGVFVICLGKNAWRILGARSSAKSLHHALCTAAVSVS